MGLSELAQLGWYKREASSPQEIRSLFTIVERCESDVQVDTISDDLRFQAAYNGILTLANIALRATGYRVSMGQGHHQKTIESLEYTLSTQAEDVRIRWVRKLKVHSQKRNMASYDLAGGVSPGDLAQIARDMHILREQVCEWLAEVHPELTWEGTTGIG
jgi:hypothetical protein